MALPAVIAYYMFSRLVRGSNRKLSMIGAALGGFSAITLSTCLISLLLVFTGEAFHEVAKLIFVSHVPVMVVESIVTMFIVNFLRKTKPEILGMEQL
jgi:cobalt/nickel transport system permease protein